jgi:hypothetical protein
VEARFSAPVQTGPEAHPASYIIGTGSFPSIKRPGRGADHPPHLAPRLKEEQRYISNPSLGLRGLFKGELYLLPLYSHQHVSAAVAAIFRVILLQEHSGTNSFSCIVVNPLHLKIITISVKIM